MINSSKFGYYPIKINKYNEIYTKGLINLSQEYNKYKEIESFRNSNIVKNIKNDFEKINMDIQNQYLKPSIGGKFNSENLYDTIERLGIFGLEIEQLFELGQYVKNVRIEEDVYIGHNIVYPNYENKWCFAEFKNQEPLFIAALFTDDEYSKSFVKITSKELFKRYNSIKEITTLDSPSNFSYILKNINDDLKLGIEGIICYMPFKNEIKLVPSIIRENNKKENK